MYTVLPSFKSSEQLVQVPTVRGVNLVQEYELHTKIYRVF
jgi:hypothetical protein